MSNRPKMEFKLEKGQFYAPSDDAISNLDVLDMLNHYFKLQDRLREAEEVIKKFVENEEFMREVHPVKIMEKQSMYFSFDVFQQFYFDGKGARAYLAKYSEKEEGK